MDPDARGIPHLAGLRPAIANVYDLNGQGDLQVHVDDPTQILTLVVARVDLVSEPADAMGNVRAMLGVSVPAGQSFYPAASLPAKAQQMLFVPKGYVDSWMTPGPGRFDIFAFPTVSVGGWYYLFVDLISSDAVDINRGWEFRAFSTLTSVTMPTEGSKSEVRRSPWGRRGQLTYAGFPGARVTLTASRKDGCGVAETGMTRAIIRDGSTSHWEPLPYTLDGEKMVYDKQPVGDMPPRILLLGMSCDSTTYTVGLTLS